METNSKPSFFESLLSPISGVDLLRAEKARLEAFLDAVPGEYCAFARDTSAIYSPGFLALFGIETLESITDIQAALDPSDAAVLEGMILRLEDAQKNFTVIAATLHKKIVRLSGRSGTALDDSDRFIILWAEDVTDEQTRFQNVKNSRDAAEREMKRLQGALDHVPLPLWIRRADTTLDWCNTAYGRLVGTSPAEAIVQQKEPFATPQDPLNLKEMAVRARDLGTAQHKETVLISGGKRRNMRLSEHPLPGAQATIGMAEDISAQEDLRQNLTRSMSAYTALLEHLNAAIALFAQDESLEFYNAAFASLWNLEESWLNKRPKLGDILEKLREMRKLPEQTDFRRYKQDWLNMFTRLIDPHEDMLYLPDDTALRMLIIPHPVAGLMMIFEDVTSRLNLESSYNTLIAVQRETLDNLAEGVAVYGSDGRLKLFNPAFGALWDIPQDLLQSAPHISIIVQHMAQQFEGENIDIDALIAHGLDRRIQDGRLSLKEGRLVDYTSVPLPDGGVLVSYYDVTDSVQIEHALREKNAALEAAEQLKTDFLANVSYQLRTPLSSILGFTEILDQQYFGNLNDKQKEYTTGIQQAGERLTSLIDDILDLASFEAGYLELEKEEFDGVAFVQDLHETIQDWAGQHGLSTQINVARKPLMLHADKKRIKQALLNLIRNAIHHTPLGGTIEIGLQQKADLIIFRVSDSGSGIEKSDHLKIFEPFERSKNSQGILETKTDEPIDIERKSSQSAGLGLTIVRNIAQLHGGQVRVESTPGQGSHLFIEIPKNESIPNL